MNEKDNKRDLIRACRVRWGRSSRSSIPGSSRGARGARHSGREVALGEWKGGKRHRLQFTEEKN